MKNCKLGSSLKCQYQTLESVFSGCMYEGYCDNQLPIDSRGGARPPDEKCTCNKTSAISCPIH